VTARRGPQHGGRSERGFALFGLMVVLAIVAMGVGVMVVFADRVLDTDRADVVAAETEDIYRAIVGDGEERFGYFGDVGAYPASLYDLVVNPGSAGWNGPYLDDASTGNGMLLDPWGQPYEFWVIDEVATSDRVAIISRGADGLSTNTAANPNLRAAYAGVAPGDAAYLTDARNVDNAVFPIPDPSQADTLNVSTDGVVRLNLRSFDVNPSVNAFTEACPSLFSVVLTSIPRGTTVVPATPYSAGFEATVPQGAYRVVITRAGVTEPAVEDSVVLPPNAPSVFSYNLTGLDSRGTPQFNLTFTNMYFNTVQLRAFGSNLGNWKSNETITVAVRACSVIEVRDPPTTLETFTMPYSNYTSIGGATAAAVTVTNNLTVGVQVFNNGLYVGDVKKKKVRTFNTGLDAGDTITINRIDTGALLRTLTLVAGSQSTSVP
jgi:hypothetical protein